MGRAAALIVTALFAANALAQDAARAGDGQAAEIQATTAAGEKVRLLPNGRWEYADPKKAEPQRKAREAEELARERNAQGGLVRHRPHDLSPGDKDYNRGSLNPNRR